MTFSHTIRLAIAALLAVWGAATLSGHTQTMLETGANQPKQMLSKEQMAGQKARAESGEPATEGRAWSGQ